MDQLIITGKATHTFLPPEVSIVYLGRGFAKERMLEWISLLLQERPHTRFSHQRSA